MGIKECTSILAISSLLISGCSKYDKELSNDLVRKNRVEKEVECVTEDLAKKLYAILNIEGDVTNPNIRIDNNVTKSDLKNNPYFTIKDCNSSKINNK